MATLTLRPSADSSLGHTCSSGSAGYALIDDSSADGDSTYIYQSLTSRTSSTHQSVFTFPEISVIGIPSSVKLVVSAKDSDDNVTSSLTANLQQAGVTVASISQSSLSTSYTVYSGTGTLSSFDALTLQLVTTGKKSSTKDDDGYIRITQAYVEITYTEVGDYGLYLKQSGTWTKVKGVYKKSAGIWTLQASASDLSTDTNYVKMN